MRIADVVTYAVQPAGIPLIVAKVVTDQPGLHGWGCGTFTQRFRAVEAAIERHVKPFAIGRDAQAIADFWHSAMHDAYWRNGPVLNNAVSAVEMALWDIKGKAAGLPCYQLWGGRSRGTAAVYVHADGREPQEVLDRALQFWEQGFRHIRCQIGGYEGVDAGRIGSAAGSLADAGGTGSAFFDPGEKLRRVPELFAHLRAGLPPEAELLYDIHERLAPIDAVRLAKALEPYRLFFLEDPLAPEDLGYFRMLRSQCAVPLAMGELFVHPLEVEPLVSERLIDFVRVHVSTYGGITAALRLAHLCAAFGVRTAGTDRTTCHPSAWPRTSDLHVRHPGMGVPRPAEEDLFPGIPEVSDGAVNVNERPGWGIEMDERLAARFPCDDRASLRPVPRLADGTSCGANASRSSRPTRCDGMQRPTCKHSTTHHMRGRAARILLSNDMIICCHPSAWPRTSARRTCTGPRTSASRHGHSICVVHRTSPPVSRRSVSGGPSIAATPEARADFANCEPAPDTNA